MPHFAVDETAHMHRKVTRAGNAAFGLWVRLGSYACDYLTDGVIPAEVVALYGTPPQMRKLLAVGMLHAAGHDCPRCPAAAEGDFVVHDYIGPNPSRATVEKKREQAAEKKRRQRASEDYAAIRGGNAGESRDFSDRNDDFSDRKESQSSPNFPGQADMSPGDNSGTRAHAHPSPSPSPASPTEKQASKGTAGPQIPAFAADLVETMTAAGMVVGWRLSEPEWFAVHGHIKRCGTPALVQFARRRWNPADPPQTARYLTRIWSDLPSMPTPGDGLPVLRAVDTTTAPTQTSAYLADMAAIADEIHQAGGA
jgi:hypothetical protein